MRLVCISDTHGLHYDMKCVIPEGDVLIVAGDICSRGSLGEVRDFNTWVGRFPHPHKLLIAGNHDWAFERTPGLAKLEITNATYLEDSSVEIDGVVFYGSPWTPWFHSWAFNQTRGKDSALRWSGIPDNVNVLITHGPPKGVLDKVERVEMGEVITEYVGCGDLKKRLKDLSNLKVHIFGHIHEGYGSLTRKPTTFVNASTCDARYRPVNAPIVVDI